RERNAHARQSGMLGVMAKIIADLGRFDLDDLGAELTKHGGAGRPGNCMGQIEDLDSFERLHSAVPASNAPALLNSASSKPRSARIGELSAPGMPAARGGRGLVALRVNGSRSCRMGSWASTGTSRIIP